MEIITNPPHQSLLLLLLLQQQIYVKFVFLSYATQVSTQLTLWSVNHWTEIFLIALDGSVSHPLPNDSVCAGTNL